MDDHCCVQKYCTKLLLLVVTLLLLLTDTTYSENITSSVKQVYVDIGGLGSSFIRNGFVELSFDGVTWFTINPNYDGWEVGSVVCRHNGFGPPSYASSSFARGEKEQMYVFCHGDEMSLAECQFETNSTYKSAMVLQVSCLPASIEDFHVVLARKYTFMDSGYVLAFVDGRWGPICTSSYPSTKVCTTLCKQLEYGSCQDYSAFSGYGVNIKELPVLGELECGGNANSLKACRYRLLSSQSCKYPEDQYLDISCSNYDHNYHATYENNIYDRQPHHLFPNGRSMAIIAFVVTTFLCVLFYMCRKSQQAQATASSRTQQHLGNSVPSASLLHPCHSAVMSRTTPECEPGLYPLQSCPMYPPLHQTDSSLSYPRMAPSPAYEHNGTISPDDSAPVTDPDLPTYEEAIAIKTDI